MIAQPEREKHRQLEQNNPTPPAVPICLNLLRVDQLQGRLMSCSTAGSRQPRRRESLCCTQFYFTPLCRKAPLSSKSLLKTPG